MTRHHEKLRFLDEGCTLDVQPIHDLHDMRPRRGELLLRDRTGRLPHAELMACAHEAPLQVRIDEWVIQHAVEEVLPRLPGDIGLNINVSQAGIASGRCLAVLSEMLAGRPEQMRRFMIEVSETALSIPDERVLTRQLNHLRDAGVGLALDDFGSGSCGIRYLLLLPYDMLKLDISLTRALPHCSAARHDLVQALLAPLRQNTVQVVAEGVEQITELAAVESIGCTGAQGYLLARPMPLQAFLDMCAASPPHVIALEGPSPAGDKVTASTNPRVRQAVMRPSGLS